MIIFACFKKWQIKYTGTAAGNAHRHAVKDCIRTGILVVLFIYCCESKLMVIKNQENTGTVPVYVSFFSSEIIISANLHFKKSTLRPFRAGLWRWIRTQVERKK
jgi:hypothetical protein